MTPKGQTPNHENSWKFYLATIARQSAVRQYGRLSWQVATAWLLVCSKHVA